MSEISTSPTRSMFETLSRLYKQGQLLLLDSDRLMGEHGWTPRHNNAVAELSNSANAPQRWFSRWAMRFYSPARTEASGDAFNRILFVSIHFASDVGTGLETQVDEPLVCAGRLLYEKPMTFEEAGRTYDYWMCKYWFIGEPHEALEGWRRTGQSRWYENLKGSESFTLPLYKITSSDKLRELVIDPLLAVQEQEDRLATQQ